MSDQERKLIDMAGQFALATAGDREPNLDWTPARLLLSTRRLVIAEGSDRTTIPLGDIEAIQHQHRTDATEVGPPSIRLRIGDDVLLVAPDEIDPFERRLYEAILDGVEILYAQYTDASDDTAYGNWRRGHVTIEDGEVVIIEENRAQIHLAPSDISSVEMTERTIGDTDRDVVEIIHDGTATAIAGTRRTRTGVVSLLTRGHDATADPIDLDDDEKEVLLALYSGVSPFELPTVIERDVDHVESIYAELVDRGVLEEIRRRREVELSDRGRNLASEAMNSG